jgi:hypothetical protein
MVALSNTRSGGERTESPRGGHNEGNQDAPRIVVEREPDEHTRLLPQPSTRDGYLSPDDPAVSFSIQCFNITLLIPSLRSRHTISGACGSCATSPSYSWYDP